MLLLASFVCPLMDEAKRLMQFSWWEGLVVGKTGSCFGRQGLAQLLSKTLTRLSADGWSCPPFLVFLWPEMTRTSMVGLVVTSKRGHQECHQGRHSQTAATRTTVPGLSPSWPTPPQETLQHQQVVLVQSPVESLLLSSELLLARFCCALQNWSLFPPALWKSCNQIPLAFKVRFPGDSRFFVGSPGWKAWGGFWTFTIVGELLWYYCSPVCGSPIWWVCDLILLWLRPSYHLAAASLSLDMGYLFLVGSSVFLLMVVQQLVVILLLLEEEISACPSTLPSWTGRLILS